MEVIGMYKASDIALWFLYKNAAESKEHSLNAVEDDVYEGITNLKLQKLLYYAQGVYLALYNERLFSDNIMAWEHGPVVVDVYKEYKENGRNQIKLKRNNEFDKIITKIEGDSKASNSLNLVYDNFAIYTAWQLRNMTHEEGSPWSITVAEKGLNNVIRKDLIKDYFIENVIE